jgi:hypothetical protein
VEVVVEKAVGEHLDLEPVDGVRQQAKERRSVLIVAEDQEAPCSPIPHVVDVTLFMAAWLS